MTEPASREEALDTHEEDNLSARPLNLWAVPTSDTVPSPHPQKAFPTPRTSRLGGRLG